MLMKLFSVYDSKVESFCPPLAFKAKGEALRWFSQLATKEGNNICMYPSDFTLFEIGSFEDGNCKIVMHSTPISMGLAIEFQTADLSKIPTVGDSRKKALDAIGAGGVGVC